MTSPTGGVAVADSGVVYVPDAGSNRVLIFNAGAGTGAVAEDVLGQSSLFGENGVRIERGSHPGAAQVAIDNDTGRMAVANPLANRVSLYLSLPDSRLDEPEAVLGQGSFGTSSPDCSSLGLNGPEGVAITHEGNTVVVADTGNNRVNIYRRFPQSTADQPPISVHFGQAVANACQANQDGTATLGTLNQPKGVWTDGTRIIVADTENNRVLIWNSFPGEGLNHAPADRVLGQIGGSNVAPNRGQNNPEAFTLKRPTQVASDGTRIAVADTGNHRVLIWNRFPTANGANADVVLGQENFQGQEANRGPTVVPTIRSMSSPTGLHFHNGKLYVSDQDNNRILVFEPQ